MRIRSLERDRGGSHVSSTTSVGRAQRGRPDIDEREALGHRCDRRAGGLRADRFRCCRARNACPGRSGGHGDARVVRGERRDPRARRGHEAVHEEDGHRGQDAHVRARPVPGADQQLPAGPPGRRVHLVRRLPDAVLRREGPGDPDRRRLEGPHAADAARLQGRLDGSRRAPVLRAEQELPMGRVLPQEPVEGEGLHGPQDLGAVQSPRQEDADRRADADRVHGQGRLAPDGLVRHHQHADQRLRVPRAPHGGEAIVGQPCR